MKELSFRIPISFGDNSMLKSYMDQIADGYDTINICHHLWYVEKEKNNNPKYYQFCKDIGNLYFSSPPYKYDNKDNRDFPYIDQETFIEKFNLSPNLPNLQFYLCRGEYPIISEPYIVLPTKIRYLHRIIYNQIYDEFWDSIKHLSKKYKIVILGERKIEQFGDEFTYHGPDVIYSIYNDFKKHLDKNRIIDLTINSLGHHTAPDLAIIQRDCQIIKNGEFSITLGIAGSFVMNICTAKYVIGYRTDELKIADMIYNQPNDRCFIKSNWQEVYNKLIEKYSD